MLIAVEMMFAVSVASIAAALVPLLPDLGLIIDNGLIVMMFLSGIFFDVSTLSPKVRAVVELNPMVSIISGFRDVFMYGRWPDWVALGLVFAFSAVVYAVAYEIGRAHV